jgi:glutamyl endopeptidase
MASYQVTPGRNGATAPYGTCGAKTLYTVNGWTTGNPEFDYGAIKLNCSVGDTTGWFGFFATATTLNAQAATVTGYPGDKPSGTQWTHSGVIAITDPRKLWYSIDTAGGQSGAPVWAENAQGCAGPCAMAIHAYGQASGAPPPGNTYNSGTRITTDVFNNLTSWAAAK